MERPRRRQKPGSYEQKYAAVSESGTKMGSSGSHLRKVLLTPGWTGNFLVVTMGNPQALSEMGARMSNDLGRSGPPTLQGLIHHPPPCPSSPTGRSRQLLPRSSTATPRDDTQAQRTYPSQGDRAVGGKAIYTLRFDSKPPLGATVESCF